MLEYSKYMRVILFVIIILLVILVFFMYCDIRMYNSTVRSQLIEFHHLAEFHQDFINQNNCITWEQYITSIEQYNNKNNGRRINTYLNRCKIIKCQQIEPYINPQEK
jgi:amino acid permease